MRETTSLKTLVGFTSIVLLNLAGQSPLHAQSLKFKADMSQAWNENFALFPTEGTGSSATGLLTFDYDTDLNYLSNVNVFITGISQSDFSVFVPGRSHIHPSKQGLQIINIGQMQSGFVDVPGGVEIVGGSATITDDVEAVILSGTSWINIHTLAFPNGEIAGVVTAVVPLPPALWLLGSGLLGLASAARRK